MWIDNLRGAYRSLRSGPGFAATAILSLGIGIGGSVAMFTLVNSIVLKPLAYAEPGRLVTISNSRLRSSGYLGAEYPLLPLQFLRWTKQTQSLESIALTSFSGKLNLTGAGMPETLGAMRITAGFFDTLKIRPQRGRWFTESEEKRGMPNVVILSDGLWRRRFSADPDVIGKKILLNDAPHEVVGITPPDLRLFRGHQLDPVINLPERTDVLLPIRFSVRDEQGSGGVCCVGIARLKPGVSAEQAGAELNSTLPGFKEYSFAEAETRVRVLPLQTAVVGNVRQGLVLLLFSVGLVLLIACANVANLSLVRATQRSRELAIRAALGAGKGALVRHSLAESFLIALGGTIAGSIFAMWIKDLAVSWAPSQVPRLEETAADATVLAFAVGLCALTTVLFGLLPAWRASRVDPQNALNAAGRGSTETLRGGRLRAALVSAEVALGTVLVIGSGLLLNSFHRVINAPRGFDGGDLLIVDLVLPSPRYQAFEKQASFFREVHDGVASIPGVMNVAVTTWLPLAGEALDVVVPEGTADMQNLKEKGFSKLLAKPIVSAEYFTAMKIPLRAGRLFRNGGETEQVAVLSESAARILWPGEDPLGKSAVMPFGQPGKSWRIIGIVSDLLSAGLDHVPTPAFYRLYEQQGGPAQFSIVVRTALAPEALVKSIREAVSRADPEIPVPEMHPMPEIIAKSVQPRRFQAALVSGFAVVAVLLAAIGMYGVAAYSVAQRRKEIGIRIALGAEQIDVKSLIFRNGMAPVLIGLCAGLISAAFLARVIASLLFEVSTLDPITFIGAPLVLVIAAALPCWLTARQAARIDPVVALRLE